LFAVTLTVVDMMSEQQGFSELSKAFKRNPTIENCVKLRRENPDEEIEIAISDSLDWLFANSELLREIGVDPQWFASALDANSEAISKLSLRLLEKIIERKQEERAGQTQLVSRGKSISDSLVNYLAACMLDALSWNDQLEIPRDLIVLLRHQIIGDGETEQSKQLRSHKLGHDIGMVGAQLLEAGIKPSARNIAKTLSINASTVSRIFPEEKLLEESKRWLGAFQSFKNSTTPFADMATKRKR
jgi:hypothetical protein